MKDPGIEVAFLQAREAHERGTKHKRGGPSHVPSFHAILAGSWNSPLSKRVAHWGEDGRAFNYGTVWGRSCAR